MALQEVCEGRKIGRMPGGMQLASGRFVAALPSSRYLLVLGMAYVGLYVCSQGSAGLGSAGRSQSVSYGICLYAGYFFFVEPYRVWGAQSTCNLHMGFTAHGGENFGFCVLVFAPRGAARPLAREGGRIFRGGFIY